MGRSKKHMSSKSKTRPPPAPAPAAPVEVEEVPMTAPDLLAQAAALIASVNYEQARDVVRKAVELSVEAEDAQNLVDSLEILGVVQLELGELESARENFLLSIEHSSNLVDPSPSPHLYLAQLSSPEESLTHFSNALTILQAKIAVIEQAKLGGDGGAGTEEEIETEGDLRRSASRALVGMTEVYLTDLCFEADAEEKCEKQLALAESLDPSDPEVYQTLASVRLSQQREEDAKAAALKGWNLWRKLGAESPDYPVASTRLSLAKLFIELSSFVPALEILQVLENEDDEDAEVWYLSGWAWWLLGESRGDQAASAEEEDRGQCWSEGRLCLENYLRLDALDPESSDPEQMAHVQELIGKMDAAGIVASEGHVEGADEWEDDSEGEDEDVDMA